MLETWYCYVIFVIIYGSYMPLTSQLLTGGIIEPIIELRIDLKLFKFTSIFESIIQNIITSTFISQILAEWRRPTTSVILRFKAKERGRVILRSQATTHSFCFIHSFLSDIEEETFTTNFIERLRTVTILPLLISKCQNFVEGVINRNTSELTINYICLPILLSLTLVVELINLLCSVQLEGQGQAYRLLQLYLTVMHHLLTILQYLGNWMKQPGRGQMKVTIPQYQVNHPFPTRYQSNW